MTQGIPIRFRFLTFAIFILRHTFLVFLALSESIEKPENVGKGLPRIRRQSAAKPIT